MKPNELRIGNYVQFPSKAIYSVDVLYKNHQSLDFWEPITLTEEWLLKLGFKNYNPSVYVSLATLTSELHFERFRGQLVASIKGSYSDLILNEIKYVHELQNLYYALTGDELTLAE